MNNYPLFFLILVSVFVGIVAAVIYRYTGDQKAIHIANNRIKASLLELRLFDYSPRLILLALVNIYKNLFHYFCFTLKPIIILLIPVLAILQFLHYHYSYAPFTPGDVSVLTVKFENDFEFTEKSISLIASRHLEIDSAPVYIPTINEISWNLKILESGQGMLSIHLDQEIYKDEIIISDTIERITPTMEKAYLTNKVLNYGASFLPVNSLIKSISVEYPKGDLKAFGFSVHWLLLFIVFSMIPGAVIMKIFNISW